MNMHSRALLGSALVPVFALAVTAPCAHAVPSTATSGTTTAAATTPAVGTGPWATPKQLAGVTRVIALQSSRNGTVAGLFVQGGKTVLSVRPAGSTAWGSVESVAGATLQRTDDGALTLLWWEKAADATSGTLRMSRLAPDATAFGPAEAVATGIPANGSSTGAVSATVAAGTSGVQAVAWMDKDNRLTVTQRSGPTAAWSAPTVLDRLPDPIVRTDNVYDYHLHDLRLAVDKNGTIGLIWGGDSYYTGDGVDYDPTAYQWYYKYLEKPAGSASWTVPRDLPQLGEKPNRVTLAAHPQGGFHLLSFNNYARKAAGAANWGPAESTGIYANGTRPAELLTAPNGDVSAVGSASGPAVATRLSTGGWKAPQDLADNTESGSYSSTRTADGSLVVTYTQRRYVDGRTVRRDFVAQTVGVGSVGKSHTLNSLTDGTTSTGAVAADDKGRPVAVWTQAATDGSSVSSYTATTGTRALPKWRDYADSTRSDILGIGRSGTMNMLTQDAANPVRTFQERPWAAETKVVPFGDFDGNRCNDLVVRMPGGEARLYTPVCGGLPTPDSPYKRLSSDWSAYDTLLSSGDQTGDGRPDLLARNKVTGDLYLYAHNGTNGFLPRVKIRSGWTGYKRVIGAGDLNGDGLGDVLALDSTGKLWRYNGTRTGKLKDRVQVFKDWGRTYKDVIGAGDINGDGKNDLVSRDTSDNLWLNTGTGTGTFKGRVQAGDATYWKNWASLG
ncbi:FG-GAP repeat domain-containing protein [Streptomyces aureus]|uniref:FG-GAP repeat domain-containing protein n=1 Tax=Streptomyces aureus TaxID=193461 RepID=UPI00068FDBAC|nr:VCBS repeat-containing protein [Streptomyces aureus]